MHSIISLMPRKKSSKSSGDLFGRNSNLKWLLPLLAVVVIVSILLIKHHRETGGDEVSMGDRVRFLLNMSPDSDKETIDDTNSTAAPTSVPQTVKSY